jgi:FKBP-type peptidyl-prolyl cis-trans isomerase
MSAKWIVPLLGIAIAGPLLAQQPAVPAAADPTTDRNKVSYSMGYQMGMELRSLNMDLDMTAVIRGINDAQNPDAESLVARDEMVAIWEQVGAQVRDDRLVQLEKLAAENLAKSRQFMEENKAKKGIVVLPSGVQYREIEEGTGPQPGPTDDVIVHFRGSLVDGREFISTFAKGAPATVNMANVSQQMQGWVEILPMMRKGAKWQIFVPPELGFGERGAMMESGVVYPNETLIFDLQLIDVTPSG